MRRQDATSRSTCPAARQPKSQEQSHKAHAPAKTKRFHAKCRYRGSTQRLDCRTPISARLPRHDQGLAAHRLQQPPHVRPIARAQPQSRGATTLSRICASSPSRVKTVFPTWLKPSQRHSTDRKQLPSGTPKKGGTGRNHVFISLLLRG